jgi:hypothetical protein
MSSPNVTLELEFDYVTTDDMGKNMFQPGKEGYGRHEELRSQEEEEEDEDEEGPVEFLLRRAPEIEAGLMPGWKLDRSQPGALLWTTPSGRQYKSTLDGSSYVPYRH